MRRTTKNILAIGAIAVSPFLLGSTPGISVNAPRDASQDRMLIKEPYKYLGIRITAGNAELQSEYPDHKGMLRFYYTGSVNEGAPDLIIDEMSIPCEFSQSVFRYNTAERNQEGLNQYTKDMSHSIDQFSQGLTEALRTMVKNSGLNPVEGKHLFNQSNPRTVTVYTGEEDFPGQDPSFKEGEMGLELRLYEPGNGHRGVYGGLRGTHTSFNEEWLPRGGEGNGGNAVPSEEDIRFGLRILETFEEGYNALMRVPIKQGICPP